MAVRLKPAMAAVCVAATALLAFGGGTLYVRKLADDYKEYEAAMPQTALEDVMQKLSQADFSGIYENTEQKYGISSSKAAFEEQLAYIFDGTQTLRSAQVSESDDEYVFRLYSSSEALADIRMYRDGGEWKTALPMQGTETYTIEVPAGSAVTANGTPLSQAERIQQNVPGTVFDQLPDQNSVPKVDIYELSGVLGEPEIEIQGIGTAENVENILNGHIIAGRKVDDPQILQMIIDYAKLIAQYPAQETSLGAVSAICDTSASWYQRYTTLQNYWFTSHSVSEFTNQQVLRCTALSDDTMIAHVVFDYFADNGEVHRTWHIGYQMTLRNYGGTWKVAGMGIDNELNPNTVDPESDPE